MSNLKKCLVCFGNDGRKKEREEEGEYFMISILIKCVDQKLSSSFSMAGVSNPSYYAKSKDCRTRAKAKIFNRYKGLQTSVL
jgi:hypothetical protein